MRYILVTVEKKVDGTDNIQVRHFATLHEALQAYYTTLAYYVATDKAVSGLAHIIGTDGIVYESKLTQSLGTTETTK